jgi:kojibiose phosphorylase
MRPTATTTTSQPIFTDVRALLFDLDGVLTRTATLHAAAWKRLFDEYLAANAQRTGASFVPFDVVADYRRYVDGKPRYDGVQSFLAARSISLPWGSAADPPDHETIAGLGNRKDRYFEQALGEHGVETFPEAVSLVRDARARGLKTAVVSSSKNCGAILRLAGILDLFDAHVDGMEAERLHLPGKPAPDTFLEAARRLQVAPDCAVVFEDAISGVEAGKRGGFKVVGVDESGQAEALREHGADLVVSHLGEFSRYLSGFGAERSQAGAAAPGVLVRPPSAPWAVTPTQDEAWALEDRGFVLAREHEIESLFAVGNGALGIRGSVAEGTSLSDPATFVAGVFDIEPSWNTIPGLMVLADWTDLRVLVDGRALSLESGGTLEHRRLLDLEHGVLWREWLHRDEAGRVTRLQFLRLASLADRALAVQGATIMAENYTGHVRVESHIGLSPVRRKRWGAAPAHQAPSLRLVHAPSVAEPWSVFVQMATTGRSVAFATAAVATCQDEQHRQPATEAHADALIEAWDWDARVGDHMRLDRFLTVDRGSGAAGQPATAARRLAVAVRRDAGDIVKAHTAAWAERWQSADVCVGGDEEAQRALRFAIYHLVSAANPDDPRVSIGARALTGEGYRGHVFWDTEIYALPFYVYTDPAAARSLLEYRYHTLPGARRKAQAHGYRGALYAWESTDTGDEMTPTVAIAPGGEVVRILTGDEEHHISADIAYAVWQYWLVTGDDRFFVEYGAEIIVDTARFWASRGTIEADGLFHIRRVIGPDEYHETIDDNAYTNVMAQWNLTRAAETARLLADRWPQAWQALVARLGIEPDEPGRWQEIAAVMKTGFDRRSSLFEQFEGYFRLEDISLSSYEPRNAPMDIILQRERLQKSKVVKQADVVALTALLWDEFPRHVHEANFRYYEPRTAHGSSLSPALHALVAARLCDDVLFDRLFRQASEIDLANNMGNASGGVHIAALGGLWQAAVLGIGGLRPRNDGVILDPHLPRTWSSLRFPVQWRGRHLTVELDRVTRSVEVGVAGAEPMVVALEGGRELRATPGGRWKARHEQSGWGDWEQV